MQQLEVFVHTVGGLLFITLLSFQWFYFVKYEKKKKKIVPAEFLPAKPSRKPL